MYKIYHLIKGIWIAIKCSDVIMNKINHKKIYVYKKKILFKLVIIIHKTYLHKCLLLIPDLTKEKTTLILLYYAKIEYINWTKTYITWLI